MKIYHGFMCRSSAAVLALLMAAMLGSTGCGSTEENSSESAEDSAFSDLNFEETDDLEYGATMRQNDDYEISLEYDKRYLETEELEALASYYTSIQNEDVDLFNEYVAAFYIDYFLEDAYGGLLDNDAYVAQQNEAFSELLENFTFSLLSVTDCVDEKDDDSEISYLQDMCIELEGQEYYDEHWEGCKMLTVEPTLTDGESSIVGNEMNVFIVKMDGSYYICA